MSGQNNKEKIFLAPTWSDAHSAAYRSILNRGGYDSECVVRDTGLSSHEAEALVDDLLALRLLRNGTVGDDDVVVAADPKLATARLLGPAEAALRRQEREIETFRAELDELSSVFTDSRREETGGGQVEWVDDLDTVLSHISAAARECTLEVLTAQPGGAQPAHVLTEALPRDLELLRRGVQVRNLYQHTTRFDPPTQLYVEQVSRLGAEVRTMPEFFERMIIFDRKICFLAAPDDPTSALIVRQPAMVAFLLGLFDRFWNGAQPYSGTADGYLNAHTHTQEIHVRIVEILADGLKDEVAARRLGMSVRTLRKHIAMIMQETGATSRFQLGWAMGLQHRPADAPAATADDPSQP
ncbi:LuxR family transcriptional regulator [Streptomyces sp. NBC_00503]|uniref:LuxR family transcriptional regulator n=1 Tax=Streptomyces sp. NBC_00503 TaxID=2903659 RepID=UPI002E80430B|nr:LuxR family transcriptional regulator [Streptomyces sp. NBC_00503]WUD84117.1 LuxR family transcriptional regulator [Streptomyces sp. NBC_00503]